MSMYFIGIDISKYKHDCCIISAANQKVVSKVIIKNNKAGFNELLTIIHSLANPADIRIGFESTAHYALNLELFLENSLLTFMEVNPVLISEYKKSKTLRRTKTDSVDCESIARWLMTVEYKPHSKGFYHAYSLKSLTRLRDKLIRQRSFYLVKITNAFSFQLKQLIDRMNFLDKQIEALDCQILEYYEKFDCYLHTIPGIGIIGAATILAEIGDISRFKNSSALVAFAGIDPTVRQSGEFNSTHNHMSKRGSPYLRHAIFLAATTCSFHNSPLNAYYKKKRDQGKHHLTATGAVARKLTTIIYAVLRDSKPYEPKKFC